MRRFAGSLLLSSVLVLSLGCVSSAEPVDNVAAVGRALQACWRPPQRAEGSFVTLSFSFRRDGMLIGRPRPTVVNVAGDGQTRQQFVQMAIVAVQSCQPLRFSPAFAAGIGGQVFTIRLAGPDRRLTIPQYHSGGWALHRPRIGRL